MASKVKAKLGLITVEPVMFLYQLSVFTQFGIMQDLIYQKVCLNSIYKDSCSNLHGTTLDYVQKEGSYWIRYNNIALFIPATLSSMYMGSWCSLYGSKFPMLMSALGAVFSNLINIVLSVYINTNVGYILIGQILQGFFGAGIGLTMATMSYISNVSSKQHRTVRIGILESMLSFGATIGPFLGGMMLQKTNHASVFLFLMVINSIIVFYTIAFVKNNQPHLNEQEGETVPDPNNQTVPEQIHSQISSSPSTKNLFGISHLLSTITVCFRPRENNKRTFVLLLILASSVFMLCTAGEMDTTYLFVKDEPLKWSYDLYSYYYGFKQGVKALSLIFGLPLIKHFWSLNDITLCLMGTTSQIFTLLFLSFSTTKTMMFCVPLFSIFAGYTVASARSMLSKLTENNEHGKIFAFVAIMENICYLVASVLFNSIYPVGRTFLHGFVFIVASMLELIPVAIFIYMLQAFRKRQGNIILTEQTYEHLVEE